MGIFGVLTENNTETLNYFWEIKNNMKKPGPFSNARGMFQPVKNNKILFVFDFPLSIYTEVIMFLMAFLIFVSGVMSLFLRGTAGPFWYQYVFMGILLGTAFFNSELFLYLLFKAGLKKNGYTGKVQYLDPSKALRRIHFC